MNKSKIIKKSVNKSKIFNIITNMFVLILLSFAIIGFWRIFNQDPDPKNTEFNSSIATVLSGLFTGCLAYFGVRLSVANATKNSNKSLLSSTITKERIAWQNKLRDKFVDFNELILEMFKQRNRGYISTKNAEVLSENLKIKQTECQAVLSYITLLLNPLEIPHKKLQEELNKVLTSVSSVQLKSDMFNPLNNVEFLQQVLLKFEWRRIKEETDNGKEHSTEEIVAMYKEIACNIDPNLAKELLGFYDCCTHSCNCKCK
ncbi:hypothetical protein [Bacillus altitudinis]|uniref:hypothetical protein n=1 Tax=Bacillus altitudinis TaxID=293387 RepID=UPI0039BF877D